MTLMLLQIDYKLTFSAPFHMGTGISAGLLDRTVIRDAHNYLYIPASTFKGVVREHCEQLFRFYLPNMAASIASPHDLYEALADFGRPPTLITRIFGSQLYPGTLHFANAVQSEADLRVYDAAGESYEGQTAGKFTDIQTSVSTQVRIDRPTRTAVESALYTSEFGIRALTFYGTIKGQLDCTLVDGMPTDASLSAVEEGEAIYTGKPTYSLLLLLAGLLMVERLGGNKSTGKGQCLCDITALSLDKQTVRTEQWQSWVQHLDVLSRYVAPSTQGGQA